MLSPHQNLLIEDIKGLRYTYVPQNQYWRSISSRQNMAKKITTVAHLEICGDKITARVQQYYSTPSSKSDSDLSLKDTRNISFRDNEFVKKLCKIRDE